MAVQVSPANAVAHRIEHLLSRARNVKENASIDPPLQVAELVPESEPLLDDIEGDKEVRALAVESAAKSVFYANLVSILQILVFSYLHASGFDQY